VERPKTAKVQGPVETSSPVDLRLVGIVKTGNAPARALIREGDQSTGKWISEGDTFNGWKLRSVKDRSVVVEANGRTHELMLHVVVRRADEQDGNPDPAAKPR
jgi:type II secretory pathway component PulC